MSDIGHNSPPSIIQFALDSQAEFTAWIETHPVLTSEEEAREGKAMRDRIDACRKDMDAERKSRVAPLNEQVTTINDEYREPNRQLIVCQQQLEARLNDYIAKEQARKIKIAEDKRRALMEAEARAKEAQNKERDAQESAASGVESDTVLPALGTDRAMADYQKASRELARAEKETHVKIGGGFRRAFSERHAEVLDILNWQAAITEMGITDKIHDAILSSAREHRRVFGELPAGIRKRT